MTITGNLADEVFKRDDFQQFFDQWNAVRNQLEIPDRRDIVLAKFRKFATYMSIYERHGMADIRYRLTGGDVDSRLGKNYLGRNIFDFHVERVTKLTALWWDTVFSLPCGGVSDCQIDYIDGLRRRVFSIMLPVTDTASKAIHVISMNKALDILPSDHQGAFRIGDGYVRCELIDIGFGLPDGEVKSLYFPALEHQPDHLSGLG